MKRAKQARPRRDHYDKVSYYHAIQRGAKKAGVRPWKPHQARHSVATRVRARFGLEAAGVYLGHARADVTEVYAERDLSLAISVAEAIG